MRLRVIKKSNNELEFELEGEEHTFCNPLVKMLLRDNRVEFAAYRISHPLMRVPRVYVRTNGEISPEEALIKAADSLIQVFSSIKKEFEKALSEVQPSI